MNTIKIKVYIQQRACKRTLLVYLSPRLKNVSFTKMKLFN